ncbi:MAG: prepilin-type N-terminal cleavage/methylation domain-containing protein [Vampirovibrio sp.]|nr:prepilin-type N-terminal cleavage/methylation domain-containing protein [Vampirovibrio sp.]
MLQNTSNKGVTLIELAVAMVIFAVLGVAVSSIVQSAQDSQMAHRVHETQHSVAMDVVDNLRIDLRHARNVTVAGTSVSFQTFDANVGTDVNVTYALAGGALTRTSPGGTLNFGNRYAVPMTFGCGNPCFVGTGNPVTQLSLNNLEVIDATPSASKLDAAFGRARFRVNESAFYVMDGMTFQ